MKKMTRKQAIEESIAIWEDLARSGSGKSDEIKLKYLFGCPLCELYNNPRYKGDFCVKCPLYPGPGSFICCGNEYEAWLEAKTKQLKRKYAKQFLNKLREALHDA